MVLAVATGRDASGVVAVGAAVLASQLAVGWHNDWLDADRDAVSGRRDKPIPAGAVSRRAVGIAALVAGLLCVPTGFLSGTAAGLTAALGLVSALSYNWPLKFTALSVLPYAVSFAALPAFVVLGLPGAPQPPWWLLGAGACLGAGAYFANVLPDLADDARTGVRGLAHRLGALGSSVAAGVLLAAASALLALGPPGHPSGLRLALLSAAVVVLCIGGYVQSRQPESRAAFRAVLVAALIDVVMLLSVGSLLS
jgi:4-hydroxybenzoate polyprenyltransferase